MKQQFRDLFSRFVADKTRTELATKALRRKIVMAPVARIADLPQDPQLVFRRFFQKMPGTALGREVLLPGAPYRLSEPLWRLQRGAPHLGEDNVALLNEAPPGQRVGA